MKVLHIGDIHLGCTLDNQRRNGELQKVFEFLAKKVKEEGIQAALLAGDVYDNGDPSPESQDLYYGFLGQLQAAGCRQIIVIAGNHDNPNFLEAPSGLLRQMDIHIVGNVEPGNLEKEVIALGPKEAPEAYVCAVPYLRNRDVRPFVPEGESGDTRNEALVHGIVKHYRQVYALAECLRAGRDIPILGMGHLYIEGTTPATKDGSKPIGNLLPVPAEELPDGFAYLALGHIHRPQCIAGRDHWRYAGSLLSMNLQENMFAPQVLIVDTKAPQNPQGLEIPDSCYQPMRVIRGNLAELQQQLEEFRKEQKNIWVKPIYTEAKSNPIWVYQLRESLRDTNVKVVLPEERPPEAETPQEAVPEVPSVLLHQATPEQIFTDYLKNRQHISEEEFQKYLPLFQQACQKAEDPSQKKEDEKSGKPGGTMRFQRLFLKNINSLYGTHVINFEDHAFDNGIFLICGNTGAGKTSILDAICLALFGCTPRINGKNVGISPERDGIMSEGTDELLAELTFSIGENSYRASFLHQRRKQGSKQPFRPAEHTLYQNGQQISSKDTKEQITQLIGMDMDQFTRCVLLAQGGFDAFLKSNNDKRAEILTSITGIDIFTDIGTKINALYNDCKQKHDVAKAALDGITILNPQDRQALEGKCITATTQCKDLEKQVTTATDLEAAFQASEKAAQAVQEAKQEQEAAQQRWNDAEPVRTEHKDALRAQNCQSAYDALLAKERDRQSHQRLLEELCQKQPELKQEEQNKRKTKEAQEKAFAETEAFRVKETALFEEVGKLDHTIQERTSQRETAEQELATAKEVKSQAENTFQEAQQTWEESQKQTEDAKRYLKQHPDDKRLAAKKEAWELRRVELCRTEKALDTKKSQLEKQEQERDKVAKELRSLQKELEAYQKERERVEANEQKAQQTLDKLYDGQTLEEIQKALLNANHLKNFCISAASYEEKRQVELHPGKPCPLCGSLEHPYCEGVSIPSKTQYDALVQQLEQRLKDIDDTKQRLLSIKTEMGKVKENLTKAQTKLDGKREAFDKLQEGCANAQKDVENTQKQILKDESSLHEELRVALQLEWTNHEALPPELDKRIEQFQNALQLQESYECAHADFQAAEAAFLAVKQRNEEGVSQKQVLLDSLEKELNELKSKRKAIFGEDLISVRKDALENRVTAAQSAKEAAATALTQATAALEHNGEEQERERNALDALKPLLEQTRNAFLEKLREFGFPEEQDFLRKRREPSHIQELMECLGKLDSALETKKALLQERYLRLQELQKQVPQDANREKNQKRLEELQSQWETAKSLRLDLEAKRKADDQARKSHADAQEKWNKLMAPYSAWAAMNNWFGSTGNTDRFGQIAQGYTFRDLLHFANSNRLVSLQNHFTLVSDDNNPLELNVLDHYRNNVVRTSRNLSGGEAFEVSLALALGLAEMSAQSQHARLGNVLLDEGFGTLDETSLDSALDLLMQLKRTDGKLVGIISHVSKLRDKIETQIEVTNSYGIGELHGAGVEAHKETPPPLLDTPPKTAPKTKRKRTKE
ncbi:MAG: exonuclease subunit SbcD [Victivallales bacterium]|nr:exonuclease subunit SbcD [Victivallales bacterium]